MSKSKTRLPQRRLWLWAVVGAVVLAGAALAVTQTLGGASTGGESAYYTVQRGPLVISVAESGTIKNREQVIIKSQVEGRNAILHLEPEGTRVKKGDLVVEIDSSKLEEQKAQQQITVINAEAAFIRARENKAVVKSQSESDIAQAELDVRFATLDLEKYKKGEYPQQVQAADGDITIAREEVQRATEKLEWSKRLHAQRYLSRVELQADELALKRAKLDLELAEGKKEVLENYTHKRDSQALQSDIEQAKKALDRTERKAAADAVQAESELRARKSEYERQKSRLAKIEDQLTKCKIYAPVAGMVVYATTGGGWRGDRQPLEEGVDVGERQELIYLPTATSMMAEVKVHESSLEKVRLGLPVHMTVDAAPGKVFQGKVKKIAVLPDAQNMWLNPDLKLYNTYVHIDSDATELRPGMSCRAEIYVERFDNAMQVPVQSVIRIAGKPTVFVKGSGGAEARTVEIGRDNNRMVHVLDGLEEGELVLLNPPLESGTAAPAADVPEIEAAKPEEKEPEAKPEEKKAAGASADVQNLSPEEQRKRWQKMSPEERRKAGEEMRKRWEKMSPEERKKLMERFGRGRRGGGRGGQRPGGEGGERRGPGG